jgi:hypothetical protein
VPGILYRQVGDLATFFVLAVSGFHYMSSILPGLDPHVVSLAVG